MKNQDQDHLKVVVLEPSTNTHTLSGNVISSTDLGNGVMKLKISSAGIVTHGEHGTIRTESPNIIKYVQQEVNPVTQRLQAAFD